jgi:DNA-directed RNA polymerase subunit M/transcription elongation factor TFIIS
MEKTANCPNCAELIKLKKYNTSLNYYGKCPKCGAESDFPVPESQEDLAVNARIAKTKAEFQTQQRLKEV